MKKFGKQLFWIVIALAVSAVIATLTVVMKSETGKTEPEIKPKLVRTLVTKRTDEQIIVSAYGTVQADREVTMKAEVSGRVIEQSPHLVVGGIVKLGEILLRLDPRDYQNSVEQEKAAFERAKFELDVEQGRQVVAKREWQQLNLSIKTSEISEELALRKPHLREKEAAFSAAKSRLEKAKLDLSRTIIQSPLSAVVMSETVEVGDYITPQSEIAKLVATHAFRVQVSIPVSKLKWVLIPGRETELGSSVRVIQDLGGVSIVREGTVLRLLGNLDPSGRMARVLVAVEDPLGLKDDQKFPLLIGTYVRVEFDGPILDQVFVLPREVLQEENKVWIKNAENQLEVRQVSVLQKKENVVYIDEGLKEGEEIVISPLSLPIPGMELQTLEELREEE